MRGRRCVRRVCRTSRSSTSTTGTRTLVSSRPRRVETARALTRLVSPLREQATLVFTAHSIPTSMAARYPYQQQYEETARLIAETVRARSGLALPHVTVYQSRSGRPEDPWLGPDIGDWIRERKAGGQLDCRGHRARRVHLRSHRGLVRPRHRSRRDLCRARRADGPRARGQRPSRIPRHDGGRRRPDGAAGTRSRDRLGSRSVPLPNSAGLAVRSPYP